MRKIRGRDYRLSPISNGDRKKREAAKHNMGYVESQAYAQDRIEDPDKYKRRINTKARRRTAALIGAVCAATYTPYYAE